MMSTTMRVPNIASSRLASHWNSLEKEKKRGRVGGREGKAGGKGEEREGRRAQQGERRKEGGREGVQGEVRLGSRYRAVHCSAV